VVTKLDGKAIKQLGPPGSGTWDVGRGTRKSNTVKLAWFDPNGNRFGLISVHQM